MKAIFLFLLNFFFVVEVFAQISNVPGLNNEVIRVRKYIDIDGSPYLYTDWKAGTITDSSEKLYNNELVKYDAYKDVVEVNKEGETMILNKTMYPKFSLAFADPSSNRIIRHNFRSGFEKVENYSRENYFEVLSEKKVVLLKKYQVKFIEEVVNSSGTAAQTKRFQKSEKFFLVKDQISSEVKLNIKSVISILGDDVRFKDYVIKERVKVKNEKDLIMLVEYYQNLP